MGEGGENADGATDGGGGGRDGDREAGSSISSSGAAAASVSHAVRWFTGCRRRRLAASPGSNRIMGRSATASIDSKVQKLQKRPINH